LWELANPTPLKVTSEVTESPLSDLARLGGSPSRKGEIALLGLLWRLEGQKKSPDRSRGSPVSDSGVAYSAAFVAGPESQTPTQPGDVTDRPRARPQIHRARASLGLQSQISIKDAGESRFALGELGGVPVSNERTKAVRVAAAISTWLTFAKGARLHPMEAKMRTLLSVLAVGLFVLVATPQNAVACHKGDPGIPHGNQTTCDGVGDGIPTNFARSCLL